MNSQPPNAPTELLRVTWDFPWDPEPSAISPAEYIGTLFAPDDLICIMTLQGETAKHTYSTVEGATSAAYIERLQKQNEAGANIYICMNPLKARRRVKENVACIRTLYTDIDNNGAAALQHISQSSLVPKPSYILQSSPGKYQVIWSVDGIQPADQEALLDALIQEFSGDPAASDMTRVLRLPGFVNHKYPEKPVVGVIESNFDGTAYTANDFRVKVASFKLAEKTPAVIEEGERNNRLASLAGKLRREGFNENEILASLETANHRCTRALPDLEVAAIAKSIAKYPPAKPTAGGSFLESGAGPTSSRSEIISIRACDIVPVPIEFLWEPYLQENALNAFYGNPGGGKGNTGIDVIARLTTARPFPTESTTDRKPINCVTLAAEEGVADTIVPRLMAAQADLARVRIVKSIRYHDLHDNIEDRIITFQKDMAALKADLLLHPEERYLFIDPITNYVGDINFNQDGEVRPVLTLLAQLAEELKITVTMVGHFNKNTNVASALDKPGGGRAWTAVPRACWGFFRHPDDKQQRMMVNLKLNNAKESGTGLLFTIGERIIGTKPDGKPWGAPHVDWSGKTDSSADEIVASEHPEARRDSKGTNFLNAALKGGACRATEMYKEADGAKMSESTLDRACRNLGILKFQMPEGWYWQHPSDQTPIPAAARTLNEEAKIRRASQERGQPESARRSQAEPEVEFSDARAQHAEKPIATADMNPHL